MATQTTCFGVKQIQITRQGDNIDSTLVAWPVLEQMYTGTTAEVYPDFSKDTTEKPLIYPAINTTYTTGLIKKFKNYTWSIDGVNLDFRSENGKMIATYLGDIKFEKTEYETIPAIKLISNYALNDNFVNTKITFTGIIESNGVEYKVNPSCDFKKIKVSENNYHVTIGATNGGILDDTHEELTVTAKLSKGISELKAGYRALFRINNNGTFTELKNDTDHTDGFNAKVGRSQVHGTALVECEFYETEGNTKVAEGNIIIQDDSDPYVVMFSSDNGFSLSNTNNITTISAYVTTQGQSETAGAEIPKFKLQTLEILDPNGDLVKSANVAGGEKTVSLSLAEIDAMAEASFKNSSEFNCTALFQYQA